METYRFSRSRAEPAVWSGAECDLFIDLLDAFMRSWASGPTVAGPAGDVSTKFLLSRLRLPNANKKGGAGP